MSSYCRKNETFKTNIKLENRDALRVIDEMECPVEQFSLQKEIKVIQKTNKIYLAVCVGLGLPPELRFYLLLLHDWGEFIHLVGDDRGIFLNGFPGHMKYRL